MFNYRYFVLLLFFVFEIFVTDFSAQNEFYLQHTQDFIEFCVLRHRPIRSIFFIAHFNYQYIFLTVLETFVTDFLHRIHFIFTTFTKILPLWWIWLFWRLSGTNLGNSRRQTSFWILYYPAAPRCCSPLGTI